jgi:hypothetical protein
VGQVRPELYPLQFKTPCFPEAWRALAQATDTMTLVLMPRAPEAREMAGAGDMAKLHSEAHALAKALEVELFVVDPDHDWPTLRFLDQGHLSAEGARHFRDLLTAWLKEPS